MLKKISFLLLICVLFTAFKCDNEPLEGEFITEQQVSCDVAVQNVTDAALAFSQNTNETYEDLCIAYKNALQFQKQFCGDPDGSLQALIDSLGSCSTDIIIDDCASAASAVGVAQAAFAQATPSNYTQLCNAYRETLLNLIEFCGNDGGTQSVLNDLGDCTNEQTEEGIVGTWLLTAWVGETPIDLNNDGVESENFLDEMNCYNNDTIVFAVDETTLTTSNSYAEFEFIIEVGTTNSFEYTVTCIEETEISNGNWTQNGNVITITNDLGDDSEWTLNGNQLSVFVPEGFFAFNSDDIEVTTIQDLTFIYTKQ